MRAMLLIVTALALAACDGAGRTYELPPPPPLAEPTAHMPDRVAPSAPPAIYTPAQKAPSWTQMPSQRTGCGRNFC